MMINCRNYASLIVLAFAFNACSTDGDGTDCDENPALPGCDPGLPELTGSVYYGSGAHTFARYDFDTQTETPVFDETGTGGFYFTVSPDGKRFAWADQYDADGAGTRIQIHETEKPSAYKEVFLESANLRHTASSLSLAPGAEMIGALVSSDVSLRKDLVLFHEDGSFFRAYPYVKDFAFTPNGQDLALSMEIRENNEATAHVVGSIHNYRSENPEAFIVKEFADYDQLPASLAVSPNSATLAYRFLDHIYTLPLQEGADHHQITTSGSKDWNVHWSPDGNQLSLTVLTSADGPSTMGRVVIVPVHANNDPIRIESNVNGDILPDEAYAPFPIELESSEGKITAKDPGPFWVE